MIILLKRPNYSKYSFVVYHHFIFMFLFELCFDMSETVNLTIFQDIKIRHSIENEKSS
jgi:hypothetical protein